MASQVLQANRVQLENQAHPVFPEHLETKAIWERKDLKAVKVLKALVVNQDDQDNLGSLA